MPTAATPGIQQLADLAGRRAVVLGLARSGTAAARFLSDAGAAVTVYDRRSPSELADAVASLGQRPISLALGVEPAAVAAAIGAADLLVTSPSISLRFPTTDAWLRELLVEAEARGVEIVGELDLFLRLTAARVLAVTGTKGKTTTTSIIGAILAAAGMPHVVGGNIGQPLIEEAMRLTAEHWAVIEVSELQLPTLSRGAQVAVYTNVAADHLDRHGTADAYRAVKARLAELSLPDGRIVLNADDPGCQELGARLPAESLTWYGLERGERTLAGRLEDGWLTVGHARLAHVDELPLTGRHQHADALAAAVASWLAGAGQAAIATGLRRFPGVPHRLETVGEWNAVRWVNDSQATIPMAAIAALRAFDPARVVLICGGKDKGLDYGELATEIGERCRAVVLLGETADTLERLIGGQVPVRRVTGMDDAVAAAAAAAQSGDVVLLAPAAASFDMFVDYAARGDAFRAAVRAIAPGERPA